MRFAVTVALLLAAILAGCQTQSIPPGMTIHEAADEGNITALGELLKDGANVNEMDSHNMPPLHFAAANGHTKACALLLEAGANVNARSWVSDQDGSTALHAAALSGNPKTCALLLKHGADVNAKTQLGSTPLSVSYGNPEIVSLLQKAGGRQ